MLGNEVIQKQIRTLKTRKTAALTAKTAGKKPTKQLDEATMKEVSSALFLVSLSLVQCQQKTQRNYVSLANI
jgi:hypothetical protein